MHPRERLVKIIGDLEELIREQDRFNREWGLYDIIPFDIGADRVTLRLARQALAALDRGDRQECKRLGWRLFAQCCAALRAHREEL